MPHYIVTMTSMVIEADSADEAIERAGDGNGGGNSWEAVQVEEPGWRTVLPDGETTLLQAEVPTVGQITVYRSEADGAVVVEIDTTDERCPTIGDHAVPMMRVHVNDDPVWLNPPHPGPEAGR